jgi:hypothetical protein
VEYISIKLSRFPALALAMAHHALTLGGNESFIIEDDRGVVTPILKENSSVQGNILFFHELSHFFYNEYPEKLDQQRNALGGFLDAYLQTLAQLGVPRIDIRNIEPEDRDRVVDPQEIENQLRARVLRAKTTPTDPLLEEVICDCDAIETLWGMAMEDGVISSPEDKALLWRYTDMLQLMNGYLHLLMSSSTFWSQIYPIFSAQGQKKKYSKDVEIQYLDAIKRFNAAQIDNILRADLIAWPLFDRYQRVGMHRPSETREQFLERGQKTAPEYKAMGSIFKTLSERFASSLVLSEFVTEVIAAALRLDGQMRGDKKAMLQERNRLFGWEVAQ